MAWLGSDAARSGRFLRVFFAALLPALAFGFWLRPGGVLGFILTIAIVLVAAAVVGVGGMYLLGRLGESSVGALTGHSGSSRNLREQLAGDIERVKHLFRTGEKAEAWRILEETAARLPEDPEVLSLKARILWEGYGQEKEARRALRTIIKLRPRDDPWRRWAWDYYKNMNEGPEGEED